MAAAGRGMWGGAEKVANSSFKANMRVRSGGYFVTGWCYPRCTSMYIGDQRPDLAFKAPVGPDAIAILRDRWAKTPT
jgi:hypothetical protein